VAACADGEEVSRWVGLNRHDEASVREMGDREACGKVDERHVRRRGRREMAGNECGMRRRISVPYRNNDFRLDLA
jgi:hypothetical protein